MKYFVTADPHSFYTKLRQELDRLGFDPSDETHRLVVCGDAFDRGEEPTKMYKYLKSLGNKLIYVRGNHEDLLQECVKELVDSGGAASPHHYSNGTILTVRELKDEELLFDALDWIDTKTVDYYETEHYVFVHGWLPTERYLDQVDEYIPTNWRKYSSIYWSKARWKNGMLCWKNGLRVNDKTVVCGHWHCSFGNSHYHLEKHLKEFPNKALNNWQESFKPFADDGIIALDACTAYSGIVNVVVLEDNELEEPKMEQMEINLNDVTKVKEFVEIAQDIADEVNVISGSYCVDGKSIMGLFSLDLTHPLIVESYSVNKFKRFTT